MAVLEIFPLLPFSICPINSLSPAGWNNPPLGCSTLKSLFAFPGIPKIYRDFDTETSLESLINKGFNKVTSYDFVRLDYEGAKLPQ